MNFNEYLKIPQINIEHILIAFGTLVIAVLTFIIYSTIKEKRSKQKYLLNTYIKRYSLKNSHEELLKDLINVIKSIDVYLLFKDKNYFNYTTNQYLYELKKKGKEDFLINDFSGLFLEIYDKIGFKKVIVFSTKDIQEGSLVKIEIENGGLFTGEVIHNYDDGLMIKLPYIDILKKQIRKNLSVKIHFWNEYEYYEIKTKIKNISLNNSPLKYLLVFHDNAVSGGLYPKGMRTEINIPVLFNRIFKTSLSKIINKNAYKGSIVSISLIGAEIISVDYFPLNMVFLFEFNISKDNQVNNYHFTGKIIESTKNHLGYRIFIKYLDMDNLTKEYINKLVCKQVECTS